jgi:hypothetical protein
MRFPCKYAQVLKSESELNDFKGCTARKSPLTFPNSANKRCPMILRDEPKWTLKCRNAPPKGKDESKWTLELGVSSSKDKKKAN